MITPIATFAYNALVSTLAVVTGNAFENAPTVPQQPIQQGLVAVIMPARNEARNLPRTLPSILEAAAQYGDATVIVVDDGSTDATPAVLAKLQATHPHGKLLNIVRIDEVLPPDWFGKPRACWVGAQQPAARDAEWLWFVDADTGAFPHAIGRLLAGAIAEKADLYSIMSAQELESVPERLIMPHIFYAIGSVFSWQDVNDPKNPLAIANGQCMFFRRSVYDVIGGHRVVKGEVAEDRAIADIVKRRNHRLFLADGRDVMSTRMYTSLAEIWEGWTKNAYLGLGDQSWLLLVIVVLGIAAGLVPFIAFPVAVARKRRFEALCWLATLVTVLQNRDRAMREMNVPRWYAFTLPLGTLLCCGIAFSAWYRVVSGQGVRWKERTYATK
jgi:chlorobactene glucosyltransferase